MLAAVAKIVPTGTTLVFSNAKILLVCTTFVLAVRAVALLFGTICVLDRERNDHALLFREGLQAFAGVVEATLRSLVEIAERRRLETALQHSLDQTARHVVERTRELQDANTALRVLLGNVEQSNEARNEQLRQQINTLVLPHVAKLARLV